MEDTREPAARDAGRDGVPLRRALRARTQASHARLDALFDGMTDAETPAAYHRFIRVNEACHRAIEPALAASALAAFVPSWQPADRSSALAEDLDAMALPPLPAPPFALSEPDLAEAAGIAYVLEGSRLGAGHILSALRARAQGAAWDGASYRYLAGPDAPHALRTFLNEAALVLDTGADLDRCAAAANATFDHFLAVDAAARADAGAAA